MAYIILKFDDLDDQTLPSFYSLYEYCKERNIPVCYGLIGKSLESPSKEYLCALLEMKFGGVELWNHGYYHSEAEFSSESAKTQKESIQATQDLMMKHLGEAATCFGSPHNNSTEKTVGVLREYFPEIKNYFFMVDGKGLSKAHQLIMRCNYEIKTGVVDLDSFREEYDRIKEYPYFVMQGHPSFWRDVDYENLKKLLDVLIDDGNTFVTAEQLYNEDMPEEAGDSANGICADVIDFCNNHSSVAFYGAGEIGRETYRFMNLNDVKPDAFLVSDGHKDVDEVCDVPVFTISEKNSYLIKCDEAGKKKCGIIPTVLGKLHKEIFDRPEFEEYDIWRPEGGKESYDRLVDYIRYKVSLESRKKDVGESN